MEARAEDRGARAALALSRLLLPLIVVADGGLLLFRSVGSLEVGLEPRGVRAGRYGPAFDAEGRLLSLDVVEVPSGGRLRRLAVMELGLRDVEPAHRYRLRLELERALGLESHSGADVFDLVVDAMARFGLR